MKTEEIVHKKIRFDAKFTASEKEVCFIHIIQLLENLANHQVLHSLETNKVTTGYAYWDQEKAKYQLRIDTVEKKLGQLPEAVVYFIE